METDARDQMRRTGGGDKRKGTPEVIGDADSGAAGSETETGTRRSRPARRWRARRSRPQTSRSQPYHRGFRAPQIAAAPRVERDPDRLHDVEEVVVVEGAPLAEAPELDHRAQRGGRDARDHPPGAGPAPRGEGSGEA